jgi:hypothetical protein
MTDVEAAGAPTSRTIAEVSIKGHQHEVEAKCVLGHHFVWLVGQANVPQTNSPVATAVKERGYWLDHILIDEEL